MKKGVDIQDPLCYTITCREGENKKSQGNAVMRKCRNWQTSKTKDLVSIALVWVQVPSSALTEILKALENCPRGLFLLEKYESRKNECDRKSKVMNEICGMFEKDAAVCLRYGMVNFWSVFVFSILWVVNHIFS